MADPKTLYEKIWDAHVVERRDDGTCLLYIDRHLVHEVTSPQAFEGLRVAGRRVRRPELTLAVPDHNLPTTPRVDAAGRMLPHISPLPEEMGMRRMSGVAAAHRHSHWPATPSGNACGATTDRYISRPTA